MRKLMAGALAGVMLAGCGSGLGGPSDRDVLAANCVEDGEAEATCSCIADAMAENLSPELLKKTADAVGRNNQDEMTFLTSLSMPEAMEYSKVTSDMLDCAAATAPVTP